MDDGARLEGVRWGARAGVLAADPENAVGGDLPCSGSGDPGSTSMGETAVEGHIP
jgi:hypothetical protein